ncbi:SET domain-containing protein-lysine N-methyltransferase [Patescibacteria group bacterium]
MVFGGNYTNGNGAEKARKQGRLVMQWDDNLYSVEDRGEDQGCFVNHSRDPSLWMIDAFTLVARKDISLGSELTADYATWEADESFVSKWQCNCGSKLCRGRVTGKDWLKPELQKRYLGHFSPLLNKRIVDQ